uniref:Uncharacterized protein n=1 Tax=Steinernema glaseri TaxID=37863 RepID=A0A1I8AIL1_9BILA
MNFRLSLNLPKKQIPLGDEATGSNFGLIRPIILALCSSLHALAYSIGLIWKGSRSNHTLKQTPFRKNGPKA